MQNGYHTWQERHAEARIQARCTVATGVRFIQHLIVSHSCGSPMRNVKETVNRLVIRGYVMTSQLCLHPLHPFLINRGQGHTRGAACDGTRHVFRT